MPFVQRQIEPSKLSAKHVPSNVDNPLECVTNQTLCEAMRQLSSLLRHADNMFSDLESNCGDISSRTKRLSERVIVLTEKVENFNPRKEKIPAGDLAKFSRLRSHYETAYDLSESLFTPATRPAGLRILYESARNTTTEVHREKISFVCIPIFGEHSNKRFRNLEIETKRFCDSYHLTVRGRLPTVRNPELYEEITKFYQPVSEKRYGTLPSLSNSEVVPVDVSGRKFDQMTEFRRSLQPSQQRRRRRRKDRRRNTLGGGETKINRIVDKRSKSAEHRSTRSTEVSVERSDVDVSLDVDAGSSLATATIPDMDVVSLSSSYMNKTLSDIVLPPPPPENKSLAQMRKLKCLDSKNPFETTEDRDIPFLDENCGNPFLQGEDGDAAFSEKDRNDENYYESLRRNLPLGLASSAAGLLLASADSSQKIVHPDGTLSSSGVWTNSGSEQDKEDTQMTPRLTENTTPRILIRPKSSLSMGVVSDHSESGGEEVESNNTMQGAGEESRPRTGEGDEDGVGEENQSIHSCDTEGYYTTFHDFDGFQEVTFRLHATEDNSLNPGEEDSHTVLSQGQVVQGVGQSDEVVLRRKKKSKPPPPNRTSSLYKDERESLDTVVHISELQKSRRTVQEQFNPFLSCPVSVHVTDSDEMTVGNNSKDSHDISFADSDLDGSEFKERYQKKVAILSRQIPSMCVVTPPPSDDDRRLDWSTEDAELRRSSSREQRSSSRETDRLNSSSESEQANVYGQPVQVHGTQMFDDGGDVRHQTEAEEKRQSLGTFSVDEATETDTKPGSEDDNVALVNPTDSDKIVSITPDIVKPVKVVESPPSAVELTDPTGEPDGVTKTSSSSRLPDMLTHTPDAGVTADQREADGDGGRFEQQSEASQREPGRGSGGWVSQAAPDPRQSVKTSAAENTPKLRITSPFTSYRRSEERDDSPPPLSPPEERPPPAARRSPSSVSPVIKQSHGGRSRQTADTDLPGEDIYSESEPTAADMTLKSADRKSKSLARSDSYRKARPILSPVEVRKNRNSCDVSDLDVSSINLQEEKLDKKEAKGNFFKNIRSQFSFSSLRRKSPKKSSNKNSSKDDSYRTSGCDPTKGVFEATSPASGPRMTSTPLGCTSTRSSEAREAREGSGEVKFRTAAMKNQYQRWSFAEQSMREGGGPHFNGIHGGYIYANPPMLAHPHPHYHPHHPPHPVYGHHYGSYGHASGHRLYGQTNGAVYGQNGSMIYGQNGSYASGHNGSKRSSIASITAFEPGLTHRSPNPSIYEGREEGGYGYSVGGRAVENCPSHQGSLRSTPVPRPNPICNSPMPTGNVCPGNSGGQPTFIPQRISPPSRSNCPTPLLHMDEELLRKTCECPMCYHSIRNPCQDCGCPNKTVPKAMKLNPTKGRGPGLTDNQSAAAFFSPSSDYYSLSPDSPPPASINQSPPPASDGAVHVTASHANASDSLPQPTADSAQQPSGARSAVQTGTSLHIQNLYSSNRKSVSPQSEPANAAEPRKSASPAEHAAASRPKTPRKPSLPERTFSDKSQGTRRHSWAGDRGKIPSAKPTSLQDFKKLLSQQSSSQNPHRISAKDLLLNPENNSSQKIAQGGGGSLRKRSSPWRDQRFSVIQEEETEENRKSKENLCG